MHQAGGSGGRKNCLRCSGVRQRGIAALAAETSVWVSGKTSQTRAVLSRRGDDALAVGAERRAHTPILMAFERLADRLAGLGVPEPRRLVPDAVTMRLPSGLNAALHTILMALSGSPIGLPVSASQTRAVLSSDAVTMRLPSGLNAALDHSILMALERLADRLAGRGVPHPRRLVPDAVTMRLPSGLNAALITASSWPVSGSPIGLPVSASHTRAVLSQDAVTMRLPSGLNAALITALVMALERLADRLAGRGVPQPRRLVLRRGDDALAVGAERRARHRILMAFERLADRLAGLGVPDPRRLVRRRGDDALAVGAERRAQHLILVAFERLADRLAASRRPRPAPSCPKTR